MSMTHWKSLGDSSQYLGKQHFGPDEKKDVTIADLEEQVVENAQKRTKEVKRILYFQEPNVRPLILNSTNGKRIAKLLDTPYKEEWIGRKITLWVDPSVPNNFDPDNPGGVRVWKTLPIETDVICEDCGQLVTEQNGYSVNKIVKRSQALFGKNYCWDCSIKHKEAGDVEG